ncbi:SUF system Fe-S cluster assembly regulator [Thauera linaloolentis]|uniref:BadM/Rrf2 family transcriptional regulator n=1 Tax=Thauera linaloolentis (strain DSM 12138 / JCM 21573 / CCUG 41526 / CIP 105981 / IAM 15112 / NBRC 102519 / 47Lol) TaxID=1123367 RepID=N6Z5Z6_THAL4|nr:SUF system Fe-S cluster assembly regulator [Thauera linaloolentis]ENO89947.1 BadM/Rrf2 family transcriptional regulator [Thauera linaloolentis 47Lol = DSM 12138]MCM8566626.1 SUF system Fe-S cluster assembly regulator [Thauera linaloolentis]
MLRISKLTDYGTLIVTQMAATPAQVVSATELADALGLGLATVSKVLKALGRHGLVLSHRGTRGGYLLSRPPEQISIADIVDALEEQPFGLTECSAGSGTCSLETGCRIRGSWIRINAVVREALQGVSIAEMTPPPDLSNAPSPASQRVSGPGRLARNAG